MNTKPIIPWMGGKRRLAKYILPLFPDHECYIEPFSGGAALFFMKDESKVEVINDVNCELVNLYRVVQNHLEEFVRMFKFSLVSRKMFEFYLQKSCFGARPTGQTFGTATTSKPKLNLLRIEEDLSEAYLRLSRTFIECLPWQKVVEKYDRPHSLFYLDPPYLDLAGYGVDFPIEEYHNIARCMSSIHGKVILSINDHAVIRDVFNGFHFIELETSYKVGLKRKLAKELIIMNFKAT